MSKRKRRKERKVEREKGKEKGQEKEKTSNFSSWGWSESRSDSPLSPHDFHSEIRILNPKSMKLPKIYIKEETYDRMQLYVELCPQEIGWFGTVSKTESGDFLIDNVMLPRQEVSGAHTEASVDGLTELAMDILSQPGGDDTYNRLRFWGHSHVRMWTSPSHTDDNTAGRFIAEHPYFIRAICNKRGRAEFTLYLKEENFIINDAPWEILYEQGDEVESSETVEVEETPKAEAENATPESGEQPVSEDPELAALRAEVEAEIKDKVSTYKPIEITRPLFTSSDYAFSSLWGWSTGFGEKPDSAKSEEKTESAETTAEPETKAADNEAPKEEKKSND